MELGCTFSFYALPSQIREIQKIVKAHDLRFVGNNSHRLLYIPGEKEIPILIEIAGDGQAYANGTQEIRNFLDRQEKLSIKAARKKRLKNYIRNLFSRRGNESSISRPL